MEAGTGVRIKADPGRQGVTTGRKRERAGRIYWHVRFPGSTDFILESQLEALQDDEDPVELFTQGKFGRARDLRGNLTFIRLNGRLANLIYSMETTNTDFYAYQFKPVVNFLESPGDGILVADEVGLGKTIEAGLIWTELRSRFDARRLLVLCPAMLQEKWRTELLTKFGVDAEISDAVQVQRRLTEYRNGQRFDFALVASMQGLRPRRGWNADPPPKNASSTLARYLEENAGQDPLLDLLVVDEAHYMRNPEAMTSSLGRLLRDVSAQVVLLSATPIHLRSRDLYQLLNLVDDATFNQPEVFDFILEANAPLIAARDGVLNARLGGAELRSILEIARSHPFLASNRQLAALLENSPTDDDLTSRDYRSQLASSLEKINLLGRVVSRTRKREVEEWRVLREAVPECITPTSVEREFYENVTSLVRSYCEDRAAHEGFLLVTPQRQMSSSMPAALREWQSRGAGELNGAYEDFASEELDLPDELGPLVGELVRRAYELGNLDELWANDSKYARLSQMLKRYLAESPREKIVLFAYFRPTLKYLAERLESEGIACLTLTGGQGIDKQSVIDRFRDDKNISVLLSSEVASEGVDLQFSRVVVNYDLPWNPMKVEQRIGRIDRLGQLSPKVTIWNLFYENTIDSRIYERLYMRLGIFERALGELEAILGETMHTLTIDLLRAKLTTKQEEDRIEQAANALSNYRLQEEQLEEEAGNLIAHGDYILDQVKAARELSRWITGEDLWIYVRDFFSKRFPGCEFKQNVDDELVFDVRLSNDARFELDRYLKAERLLHLTALAANRPKPVRCAFKNRPRGTAARHVEFITQLHPLVRFVSVQLRAEDARYYSTVSVSLARESVPSIVPGIYVFTVDRWSLEGLRNIERLSYLVKRADGAGDFLEPDDAEQLVTVAARRGKDWLAAPSHVDLDKAGDVLDRCLDEAQLLYERFWREVERENNDRADIRAQSLKRHWSRQREKRQQILELHKMRSRHRMIPAVEGQITALDLRMQRQLEEIDARRQPKHHRQEICLGLVRVE